MNRQNTVKCFAANLAPMTDNPLDIAGVIYKFTCEEVVKTESSFKSKVFVRNHGVVVYIVLDYGFNDCWVFFGC